MLLNFYNVLLGLEIYFQASGILECNIYVACVTTQGYLWDVSGPCVCETEAAVTAFTSSCNLSHCQQIQMSQASGGEPHGPTSLGNLVPVPLSIWISSSDGWSQGS